MLPEIRQLTNVYIFQAGDSLATIAIAYGRRWQDYTELVDLNKWVLYEKRRFSPGDEIRIPDHWFPIQYPGFKVVSWNGDRGVRDDHKDPIKSAFDALRAQQESSGGRTPQED